MMLGIFYCNAQNLILIDKITQQTIPGVAVFNKDKSIAAVSNSKGEVSILPFKNTDTIFIQHLAYKMVRTNYQELELKKFKLELDEATILIGDFVVSANRWEEDKIEIPYRVEKISMRKAKFLNPQTTADLLETSGYVFIQKSQLAGGSPMLRGFSTNRVMLVVDGVRMNNAIFRSGNLQNVISLDASNLDDAEILFGPGAVMYGSDAIGGVMDFHTLKPHLSDSGKLQFTGNTLSRFSTANFEKTGHLDFNIGLKKWGFLSSFTFSDYDDLRAGTNGNSYFLRPTYQQTINGVDSIVINTNPSLQVNSGFSQMNLMQKIMFQPNKNWNIEYAFHYSATSNAPRYDRLYLDANGDGILDNAEWYYGPQKWMMNRLGINNHREKGFYHDLKLVIALQNYEESRNDRRFNNTRLRNQTETVNAISVNLDLDKKLNEKINLYYGIEAVHNTVGSIATRTHIVSGIVTPTNTRYPDGSTWQSYGAYLSSKFKFNSKLIMNAGIRYSQVMIKAEFDTTFFPFPFTNAETNSGALNGGLGFVFNPISSWQIYLNGSTGFRAPNIDDIGKVFDSEPGAVVVPNASLKPEYAFNFEIGSAATIGSFLKIDGAFYYTLLNNALARRNFTFNGQDSIMFDGQLSQVQAIQNITRANVIGLQAGVKVAFGKGIGLSSNISYQKGEEQSEDSLIYYPKSHVAPLFGSTHLTYERKKLKLDLYGIYNAEMPYSNLSLGDRSDHVPFAKDENGLPFVPGWFTLNFKTAFYINNYFSINAGVENITDQLYRPFASGISAPGRNFIFALRCKF